jgi:hypothetical protein
MREIKALNRLQRGRNNKRRMAKYISELEYERCISFIGRSGSKDNNINQEMIGPC